MHQTLTLEGVVEDVDAFSTLGCGAGIPATQQLVDQGFDILGVDISSAQIALAKEKDGEETEKETDTEKVEDLEEAARIKRDSSCHTHAMIYSPSVSLFRDDAGIWVEPPAVDILTSAAINAGDVRVKHRSKSMSQSERDALESRIEEQMKERMARILRLFSMKALGMW
ncbi:hypothetical protein D9757_008731 [Collybiopsis confluens]|uniref:Methyltransferase type 11 domain-containing protein n=1 Tax=Collybiopsis confluens TaxID=2823264 RepID=A0A8H5H926_9AGAR|nr:hypothetical protein D9757_008731 [Collybiopsis confluens]